MKKIFWIFFTVIFLAPSVFYAQSFIPENLGPHINSTYDDINPVISPDGKTLFFVRVNHPENTYGFENSEDIWYSELQPDGSWSEAQRIPSLNIGRYNSVLSISADGSTLLLNGIYNRKGNIWKKRGLSTSTKTEAGWSTPVKLKVKKLSKRNRGQKSSGTMSADGQYIILSFTRGYNGPKSNLFLCTKNEKGKWKRPRPIKDLNSPGSEDTPFLMADNKTLYFSSDYQTKGEYSIYKVTRMSLDSWKKWETPVPLSDTINSPGWEGYFKTNEKGSVGYFSSTNNSSGGADIFRVKMFEDNPYVIVSGKILHGKSLRPLTGKTFTVMSDGSPVDSITVNMDSATYKAVLPLGKLHTLTANAANYLPVPAKVDVAGVREFTKMEVDLKVNPLPYVTVKGRLLIKNKGQIIPAAANPRIFIDGKPAPDSVKIDYSAGTYSMNLNHGASYSILVKANKFESQSATLNLTTIDEYQEVTLDLQADEEKMALVKGKIIDKKTNKPLPSSVPVSVKVEGMASVYAVIDSVSRSYELSLPLGAAYTISASAPSYYPLYEAINLINETGDVRIFKDLVIVPIEVGQSIRLNNIFFESGRATLAKESFPELDRVINFMNENPEIRIEIQGHTDNVGSAATNLKLSGARAKSVAAYIVSNGIPSSRILSKGYGLTKPVASNKTAVGRAQNRRVEFTILDK